MKSPEQRVLSIHYAVWLVDYLQQKGIAVEQLLAGTGLSAAIFVDPDAVMVESQHRQLLFNAIALSNRPSLGLEVGLNRKFFTLASLGNAMLFSNTLREAIELGIKNQAYTGRYSGQTLLLSFYVEQQNAIFQIDDSPELGALRVFAIEEMLGNIVAQSKVVRGEPLSIKQLRCAYPEPKCTEIYREVFDCPVIFSAPITQLEFSAKDLDQPLPQASAASAKLFAKDCDRILASRRSSDLISMIRRILLQKPQSMPTAQHMAEFLCCSPRTLRRKLLDLDTTYQKLVESVRSRLAKQYLVNTQLDISQIAFALGYSDSATFNRAFKKWTGKTPTAYRV
jgi:AraC-like DNA-binding protein